MATVATLIPIMDVSLYGKSKDISTDVKIAALNQAKNEVWKVMVGADPQENWFVASQSLSIVAGTREYALAAGTHQLRQIEVATADYATIEFTKARLDDEEFRRLRALTGASSSSIIPYDVYGSPPGTLMLAVYPPAAMTLTVWYIALPAEWTALDTNIDQFPADTYNLICDWAVNKLLLSKSPEEWGQFMQQWDRDITRWMLTARRDNSEAEVVRGFME